MNKIVNKIIEKLQKVSYIINQPANKTKDTVSDKIKEKLTDPTESTNQSLSILSSLRESSIITSTGKKEREQDQDIYIISSREYLKNLELSDLIIISSMSYDFDERFEYFFEKDAFTSINLKILNIIHIIYSLKKTTIAILYQWWQYEKMYLYKKTYGIKLLGKM